MECVAKLSDLKQPSFIVQCSGVKEHAYAISLDRQQYWKRSWFHANGEEDQDKINKVNRQLPDCPKLEESFTGKLNRRLSEYYLGPKIFGLEDQIVLDVPDAILLQRMSARTKTFDMVLFYGTKPTIISVVDKADLDTIRDWYPHEIYSCGADPLPLNKIEKWMKDNTSATMYSEIYDQLFDQEESSCSEYEPESEPESEDESCAESEDDIIEVSEEEVEEVEEVEDEEDVEDVEDVDEDYDPDEERPRKKIKV